MEEKTLAVDAEAVDLNAIPDISEAESPIVDIPVPEATAVDASEKPEEPLPVEAVLATESQPPQEPAPESEWVTEIKLLNKRFGEQERLSKERERVIDRLHEENQKLKQGELLKQMMPVYRDLMRLYDDLEKTAHEYADRVDISAQRTAGDWHFFATSVTDLLYRYGVDAMPIEPGQPFDAKLHRVAAVRKTAEPEQEKTVARVLSAGFASDGRILRPAAIEVFRYEKPAIVEPEVEPEAENEKEEIKGEVTNV